MKSGGIGGRAPATIQVSGNLSATAAGASMTKAEVYLHPNNGTRLRLHQVTISSLSALTVQTANPPTTNYAYITIRVVSEAGVERHKIYVDYATHPAIAGRYCLGADIPAEGSIAIDLASEILVLGGDTVTLALDKQGSMQTYQGRAALSP
jgi:hypothetical protein